MRLDFKLRDARGKVIGPVKDVPGMLRSYLSIRSKCQSFRVSIGFAEGRADEKPARIHQGVSGVGQSVLQSGRGGKVWVRENREHHSNWSEAKVDCQPPQGLYSPRVQKTPSTPDHSGVSQVDTVGWSPICRPMRALIVPAHSDRTLRA